MVNSDVSNENQRTAADTAGYDRTLFHQCPIGLALTRTNGELADVNAAYARMIGRTIEETLQLTYWEITPDSYMPQEQEQLKNLQERGRYGPYQKEYIHKDGHLVPVRLNGVSLTIMGEPCVWSSVEDISAQILAENSLRESEQRLSTLMNHLPGMVCRCDTGPDCIISFASAGAQTLVGIPAEHFQENRIRLSDLIHPEDFGRAAAAIDLAREHRSECQFEYRPKNGRSKTQWLLWHGLPLYSDTDEYLGHECYITDISERKQAEDTIRHLAYHDALTGLVNRREFDRRLASAVLHARNDRKEHALLYVDLDHFKIVNDTCGHEAGDALLKQVTELMQDQLRERDTLARLGGDEFGILLENCPVERAKTIARELAALIGKLQFNWGKHTFTIGISTGVTTLGGESSDIKTVLRNADSACYQAKRLGRNRVCVYTGNSAVNEPSEHRHDDAIRLEKAIEDDGFSLYAQAIVATHNQGHEPPFCELLLRLKNSAGELLLPADFLPMARRYNLMSLLDRWVIRTAMSRLARSTITSDSSHERGCISINLSDRSLRDTGLQKYIQECLSTHGLAPHRICFELTAADAQADTGRASILIRDIRALGCRFALDKFDSSGELYELLRHSPVDYLKIDGRLVRDILTDQISAAAVQSVVTLGAAIQAKTIAENVEQALVKAKLTRMGVDYAQGYFIERPSTFMN